MYKLKVIGVIAPTAYAQAPKVQKVKAILEDFGYDYQLVIEPQWLGWQTKQIGFINAVRELDDTYTHVMLIDSPDVIVLGPQEAVMEAFYQFGHPWVFSAEPHIWPQKLFKPEDYPTSTETPYRYMNTGACIGGRRHMLRYYAKWTDDYVNMPYLMPDTDNGWMAKRYLEDYPDAIMLDNYCKLFQSMCGSAWLVDVSRDRLYNRTTGTCPLVVHFNGGDDITKHPLAKGLTGDE